MTVLVAIDFDESYLKVLAQAERLAVGLSQKLYLVHVAEPDPEFVGYDVESKEMKQVVAERFRREHRELQQIAAKVREKGIDCTPLLIQGSTSDTIVREAQRLAASMIIIGSSRKGLIKQWLLGSTSDTVLHQSDLPVLVVPA